MIEDSYLFCGKKGTGKTSMLAKLALKYSKKGWRCFCTEKDIQNTFYIPYEVIGKYWFPEDKPSLILIDEIACIWNSRDFKNTPKSVRDYFRYVRHNKALLVAFSQGYNDCDLQLRNQFSYIYLGEKYGPFTIYRQVVKDWALTKDFNGQGQICDSYNYVSKFKKGSRKFIYLPRYRKYFNSFSRLPIPDLPKEYYEPYETQTN